MFQHRRTPPPLPLLGPFKPLSSARTRLTYLPDGRLELTIKHDLLRGITREMLAWWFSHIDGTMDYMGQIVPRYRAWHPRDHIFYKDLTVAADGSGSAGTRRHIVEAFAGDPRFLVNIIDRVTHLDETGILLTTERGALTLGTLKTPLLPLPGAVSTLQHDFIAAPNGVRYESRLLVGSAGPVSRIGLNRLLTAIGLPEAMGRAWLRHNVEEVGYLEYVLPALYARQCAGVT